MAAATVNRYRSSVFGSKRAILATVTAAATGDTFNTKLKLIDAVSVDAQQAGAVSLSQTVAGGVVTLIYGGGGGAVFSVLAIGT